MENPERKQATNPKVMAEKKSIYSEESITVLKGLEPVRQRPGMYTRTENPLHIVLIAVPLILQTFLIFAIAYFACWLLKLPHNIAAPAGMIGASNFFELAVFGTSSPAALATTVGVLTEVPVMLLLVKIANKTKGGFRS